MNSSLPNLTNQQHVSFKVSPRRLSDGDDSNQLIKNSINELIDQQVKNNKPIVVKEYKLKPTVLPKLTHHRPPQAVYSSPLTIPQITMSRTKFINTITTLVQQLNIPTEAIVQPFNNAKNKFAQELAKQGYNETFIENEINHSTLIIMRKLYFNSLSN